MVILYVAGVTALAAFALVIWRTSCEGFGCMGIGVAWFAWVLAFAAWLGVGWFARWRVRRAQGEGGPWPRRMVTGALQVQLGLGAALVLYWAVRQVR